MTAKWRRGRLTAVVARVGDGEVERVQVDGVEVEVGCDGHLVPGLHHLQRADSDASLGCAVQ